MSTGIILGLGLVAIVIAFYLTLNIPYWILLWKKRKNENYKEKKLHGWVYSSDDFLNKFLKFCVYCLYSYGFYFFCKEIWSKFFFN